MARKPIVAGMFYDSDSDKLDKQINGCFISKLGPGLPKNKQNKDIAGIIAPHAGYPFSGHCAAWAYKEIAESRLPDLYVLIGLSHSGYGSCVSLEDWKTPYGVIEVDKEFGKVLIENSSLDANETANAQEHSIEVQLPFLQFLNKNRKIKIIPITASPDISHIELAASIAKTLKKENKKACVIASSDFTHYGINYGYLPFSAKIKENMYALDKGAIEFILKLDSHKFLDYAEKKEATICGKIPIAVSIELCKLLGAKRGRLLKYYTSGDIVGDYNSAVGYAAIAFE